MDLYQETQFNFFQKINENEFYSFWIPRILLGILVVLIIYKVLDLYGVFRKIKLTEQKLPKMRILYKKKTGKYEGDKQIYNELKVETKQTFKISKFIGIFYDDPIDTDPAKCRSIIGIAVNQGQYSKIDQFLRNNRRYKQALTRPSRCFSFTFPFISSLSFQVASFKVYRTIRKCKSQNLENKLSDFTLQIFNDVPSFLGKQIKIATLMENFEDFFLWSDGQMSEQNQEEKKDQ